MIKAVLTSAVTAAVVLCLGVGCADAPAQADRGPVDGSALLSEVAAAYQETPAIRDEMTVTVRSPLGSRSRDAAVELGPGTEAEVSLDGFQITATDGRLFVGHEDAPGKYLDTPLRGNLIDTFKALSGGVLPVPQCLLRYGTTAADYLSAFSLSRVSNLQVSGTGRVEHEGRPCLELRLVGAGGATSTVLIDSATRLIAQVEVNAGGNVIVMDMNPTRLKRMPGPLSFPTADRRQVKTIQDLLVLTEGDVAPDFTLEDLDGRQVTLSDLRGSMVVLDFWATWCGPCRMSLPKLQEFDRWARESGLPVAVFPVDMGERVKGNEAKKQRVAAYWKSQNYTMPTLMDYENSVAGSYNVGPIPHSVVVGPDGTIVKVEIGFNPNVVKDLRELAGKLVGPQQAASG